MPIYDINPPKLRNREELPQTDEENLQKCLEVKANSFFSRSQVLKGD